jgi:flagellar basal-body rod modification protein FlgD
MLEIENTYGGPALVEARLPPCNLKKEIMADNSSNPVSGTGSSSSGAATKNRLDSLSTADFTKMLVAQLQNQDPTSPVTNSELMQEVSQIRAIQSTDSLTSTLQSVLLGQNVATAGNLIGRAVKGKDAQGNDVSGTVNSVSISNGAATLNLGNATLPLANVTQITAVAG